MTSLLDLETAIFKPARQIGPYSTSFALPAGVATFKPFTAQASIEEVSIDELEITSHPVELGAEITDHSYKKPSDLILRLGWSNSGLQSLVNDITAAFTLLSGEGTGGFSYVQEIYNKLLTIQLSRIPIGIVTGKRVYSNMLIRSLTAPTTKESEHALFITMVLHQIIVGTTTASNFPDSSVQADPASTAATQNTGSTQPAITAFKLDPNTLTVGQQIGLHDGGGF